MKTRLERCFEKNLPRYLEEWKALLRFPSISAEPAREKDCRACAGWMVRHLKGMGFKAQLISTGSKPLVFAERKGLAGAPVVLFYGHYDVQPEGPAGEWRSPPYEPQLRNGRIYARGANDDKGQLMSQLKGMDAVLELGIPHPTIKVILEGEEESGSRGIARVLPGLRRLVKADILMVCDTGMVAPGLPAITMGLRGVISLTATLRGPERELHSGIHGGRAPNPATAMARIVSTLHKNDGSVAVKGFYAGVKAPLKNERELANRTPFSASEYRRKTGVPPVAGEQQFTPVERVGFRPCLEVNGIRSGYTGSGLKTIIPAAATLKLSARLVPGQDPKKCLDKIVRHLRKHVPAGMTLEISERSVSGGAFSLHANSVTVKRARRVLRAMSGRDPALVWEGASVPIVPLLGRFAGAEPLLVGFGSEDDRIHAVNESFSIEQFRFGYLYAALLLADIGENGDAKALDYFRAGR